MNQLLNIFPFIRKTKNELEQQNKFFNKVTLTGKINALDVTANLFEFTDKTTVIFDDLKEELIDALIQANLDKITNELNFKSKTAINILIRNLFERTADVGFLATDSVILDFLISDKVSKESIKKRLLEYTSKYSVYNEIVIFDIDGNAKVNINENNNIKSSKDSLITQALNTDSYIEVNKHTDIFASQDKTLIYAQRIMFRSQAIGVLCLCFKFEDELKGIVSNLSNNGETVTIADNNGAIYTNNTTSKTPKFTDAKYTIIDNKYISVISKTSGYQDYHGIESWYCIAQSAPNIDQIVDESIETEEESRHKDKYIKNRSLLNDNLLQIFSKANNLIEDIADVIINGELIAAKRRAYFLNPILDSMRTICSNLFNAIKSSVVNLEHIVKEGLVYDVKMASHLAIDIMDRNLYERANDSRWWALTPLFKEELSKKEPNVEKLTQTLRYINNLYTVYTNLFLYDANSNIIASSNDKSIIGSKVQGDYIEKTHKNNNSQNYFVSEFTKSEYYNNNATYIYSASIQCENNQTAGIGIVFDAKIEFEAMLVDSFPDGKKGFSVFTDEHKQIIATNSDFLNVLDVLDIDDKYFNTKTIHSLSDFIIFNDINYVVGVVASKGYREYKNNVYAITFVEI